MFKLGLMVFNYLHNQTLQYLVDLCQSVSSVASRQHLRSAVVIAVAAVNVSSDDFV